MSRRVLVTGASGFLGRHAIAPLLERGFEVHAVSRNPHASPPGLTRGSMAPHAISRERDPRVKPGDDGLGSDWPGRLALHRVDLLDHPATAALVRTVRPTHLLHFAWDVTPGRYWQASENLDWVAASLHLYRAFAAAGGSRVVAAGTCAEYDWLQPRLEEDAPLRPATLYGTAKHALHQVLAAAAANDGIGLAWGRIFFLYGPHEAPPRLVPSVVMPLLQGEPAMVGDGLARRDFMHVADVAAALVCVLDSEFAGPVNIATGRCHPIRDVVEAIGTQIGRPDLIRLGARPTPPGEPRELAATGAALAGLGFKPQFGLQDGLADTIAWWRRQMQAA